MNGKKARRLRAEASKTEFAEPIGGYIGYAHPLDKKKYKTLKTTGEQRTEHGEKP
jgi:hypothetical protein